LAQLAGLDTPGQLAVLTDLVCAQAAIVLGHSSGEHVPVSRAFKDAGFDSLTAVELRNQIAALTGTKLPATLVFDYPTPAVLAEYLLAEMVPDAPQPPAPGLGELDLLEHALSAAASPDEGARRLIVARLQRLLDQLEQVSDVGGVTTVAEKLESATDDELFDFIDKRL
jgi:acyl carrier protein